MRSLLPRSGAPALSSAPAPGDDERRLHGRTDTSADPAFAPSPGITGPVHVIRRPGGLAGVAGANRDPSGDADRARTAADPSRRPGAGASLAGRSARRADGGASATMPACEDRSR